ncbi:MAG: DUF1329 domain-containing protein [Alphaproteobacteria bacterium]
MAAQPACAAVSEAEAKRLEGDLTPMGAQRAGNAAGTIPAWDGGLTAPPSGIGYEPGKHHPDPFAADKPLFTITAANMAQYDAQLTDGYRALLAAYPDTYLMHVYPSRRSCAFPEHVYQAVKRNAAAGRLANDGHSVTGAMMAAPFPIPQSAVEVLWNNELNYRGYKVSRENVAAAPTNGGDFTLELSRVQSISEWSNPARHNVGELNNVIFNFMKVGIKPPSNAGSVLLMHNTLDQVSEMANAWIYRPGERRVKRLAGSAYDNPFPGSEGIRTNDNIEVFSGATDRYDWELKGKQEKIVAYNTYRLASNDYQYKDILHKGHLNPELLRYELHRVWVVEGKLKAGKSHAIAARRVHYQDEDSWVTLTTTLFDANDRIARVQEGHALNYYEQPLCFFSSNIVYDMNGGSYHIMGLRNQESEVDFSPDIDPKIFSPDAMRRIGAR